MACRKHAVLRANPVTARACTGGFFLKRKMGDARWTATAKKRSRAARVLYTVRHHTGAFSVPREIASVKGADAAYPLPLAEGTQGSHPRQGAKGQGHQECRSTVGNRQEKHSSVSRPGLDTELDRAV